MMSRMEMVSGACFCAGGGVTDSELGTAPPMLSSSLSCINIVMPKETALAQPNVGAAEVCRMLSLAPLREMLGVARAQKAVRALSDTAGMPVCDQDYRPWFIHGNSLAIVIGRGLDITAAAGSFVARANAMCAGGSMVVGPYASGWSGSGVVRISANDIPRPGEHRTMLSITAKRALACEYIVVESTSSPDLLVRLHEWLANAACWPRDSTNPRAAFGGVRVVIFLADHVVANTKKFPSEQAVGEWLTADIPSAARTWKIFRAPVVSREDFDCGLELLPLQGVVSAFSRISDAKHREEEFVGAAPSCKKCVLEGVVRYNISRKRKHGQEIAEVKPPRTTVVIGKPCTITHAVVCTVQWRAAEKKVVACDLPVFVPACTVGRFVCLIDASAVRVDKLGTHKLPVVEFPDGCALVIPNVSLKAGTCTITSCPVKAGDGVAYSQRVMHYATPQAEFSMTATEDSSAPISSRAVTATSAAITEPPPSPLLLQSEDDQVSTNSVLVLPSGWRGLA